MTKTALKKELHKAIEDIDDNKVLEAIYTILNSRGYGASYELSDEDVRVIEERKASYKSGRLKMLSPADVKKKIMKSLKK